jgi:hypothetical protein
MVQYVHKAEGTGTGVQNPNPTPRRFKFETKAKAQFIIITKHNEYSLCQRHAGECMSSRNPYHGRNIQIPTEFSEEKYQPQLKSFMYDAA